MEVWACDEETGRDGTTQILAKLFPGKTQTN